MQVSFSMYAALVKNLRGMLIIDPNDDLVPNVLRWLSRRFRYRLVGVPPKVLNELRSRGLNLTKQLRPIHYPNKELLNLVNYLVSELGINEYVAEGAVLASAYVSPALSFSTSINEEVVKLATYVVNSRVKLNNQYIKLHMRIADYSILDAYESDVELIRRLWTGKLSYEEFIRSKEAEVRKDAKRYWRLTKPDTRGGKLRETNPHPFLTYLDLLVVMIKKSLDTLKELVSRFEFNDVGAGLVTVPVVTIPNYVIG